MKDHPLPIDLKKDLMHCGTVCTKIIYEASRNVFHSVIDDGSHWSQLIDDLTKGYSILASEHNLHRNFVMDRVAKSLFAQLGTFFLISSVSVKT